MKTTSITSGQRKQYLRFVEDAAERALKEVGLDKNKLQKLIERGDKFQLDIVESIRKHSMSNQFADKEVKSSYVYPAGYKVKGITEQTNTLRQLFSGIGYADEKLVEQLLPDNAEGWFAIPKWEKLATTYGEAVEKVLAMIKKTRNGKFYNYCKGQLDPQHLRQHERTVKKLQELGEQQKKHDILVVVAQFGLRHRGRSVRRARKVFTTNEFGLGAFEIGCMLLTHPERIVSYDNLWIDCAGNEYTPNVGGNFSYAPYFCFDVDRLGFSTGLSSCTVDDFGSASAFLPQ